MLLYDMILNRIKSGVFIIAEIGVNHCGSLERAKKLIDLAKDSGCDAVKFQTWITDKVYSIELSQVPDYQKRNVMQDASEYEIIKELELSFDDFREIKKYCSKSNIYFISTPDEPESADILERLEVDLYKIASQDVTNKPFLRYISNKKLPIILSTGASTLIEMLDGIETILQKTSHLIILHCVSSYPVKLEETNIGMIKRLQEFYPHIPVGFSDHTIGYEAALLAMGLGARIFEKHITLDKNMSGPDHKASADPDELRQYVKMIHVALRALGSGEKKILECEKNVRATFSRYPVVNRYIPKGSKFKEDDFDFMKVMTGIPIQYIDLIVGSVAAVDIEKNTVLEWRQVEVRNKNGL